MEVPFVHPSESSDDFLKDGTQYDPMPASSPAKDILSLPTQLPESLLPSSAAPAGVMTKMPDHGPGMGMGRGMGVPTNFDVPSGEASTLVMMTKIDSPIDIKQVFWSFVNKDIALSHINDTDFRYILRSTRLRLYSFLEKMPIEAWDSVRFAEYEDMPVMVYNSDGTPQLDGKGKPIYEMQRLVKRSWDYDELVLDIENVVYILLTRGRFGSTFKGLTQTINVNESRMGGEPAQQKEKKWGIF